jgi:CBS domain-containing protein
MKLAELLSRKSGDTVALAPETSVAEAVRAMCRHRVGSVVIRGAENDILGIFTERDVLWLCSEGKGAELESLPITEHMTVDVMTGRPDDRVDDVLNLMTEKRFRHLPIVRDGKLIGLLSLGDLVKAKLQEAAIEAQALREYISS